MEINDQLLARYFAGEASVLELKEIDNWLEQDAENQVVLKEYYSIWLNSEKSGKLADTDKAWGKVAKEMQPRKNSFSYLKWAAALAIIGMTSMILWKRNQAISTYLPLISDKSTITKTFEDGSTITLNSFSLLEYPEKFAYSERRVKLIGEAFFDISPNPDKPFIIEANGTEIKVLGTSFGIDARNQNVRVSVKSGKVQFSSSPAISKILVKDEEAEFDALQDTIKTRFIMDPNTFAYKTHVFEFKEKSLRDVIVSLNKGYNTNIQLVGNNFDQYILTTKFDNEALDDVLQIVAKTFDLQVKKEGNNYLLSKNSHIQ